MDIGKIVGIAIGLTVAAVLLPTAILTLGNTSASGPWAGASTTMFALIGVIGIVAIAGLVYWVWKEFSG